MYRALLIFLTVSVCIIPSLAKASGHLASRAKEEVPLHYYSVCNGYKIAAIEPIKFNLNEKKLICGDPDVPAWELIPAYQAKYNITNFLQERGYYFPEFKEEEGAVVVYVGDKTLVSEIEVDAPEPDMIKVWRKRRIKNRPLTPTLLNTLEDWSRSQLNNKGYPCAETNATADAATGKITLKITSGERQNFPQITEEPIEALKPNVLRRYDAFQSGKLYNRRLLTLTSIRTETDGIVQSTYFVDQCTPEGADAITQKATAGKPRLVVLGIGADTEEYVKGKASWKQTRLDKRGSSVRLDANASYLRQGINARGEWFMLPNPSRWRLVPIVNFEHRDERQYNYISVDTALLPMVTWDNQAFRITAGFGPDLNYKKTYRGPNTGLTRFLSGIVNVSLMSHDYEFYQYDPQTGYMLDFQAVLNSRDLLSEVTAQKLQIKGEWLFNVAGFDPPLLIVGLRGGASTTVIDRSSSRFGKLPPDFLYYLGGSEDVRGFKREELPITYRTALTKVYGSVEVRLANLLPLWIQPVGFVDFGALGPSTMNLDLPAYWSPGFGVRVGSPVGVFRATFSHGFMINNNNPANNPGEHWQFYFSFGEEF